MDNSSTFRFLQICPHYVPAYHFGGALHVAHSLSRSLIMLGHQVHVCTTNLKDQTDDLPFEPDSPVNLDGVTVYYEPTLISRYWGFSPRLTRRIWTEIEWADVVFLHFHYQFASLIGGWLSRLRRKPHIIFTHGSLNRYGVSLRSRLRKKLYLKLMEQGNFRHALFTAYHSQEEFENSMQLGKAAIIPNGIDPAVFAQLPPKRSLQNRYPELADRLVYLYLGRLDAGKGLDLLLPAFRNLVGMQRNAHLVLAGGNERGYESVVRRMITELSLSDRVTLTGLITGTDKLAALQDADVYVLPSQSEGLSISMLEAMYMGLPVIVSDRVGLWQTVQKQNCGLITSLEVSCLKEALARMATMPDRVAMGQRGRKLVQERYVWPEISRNLVNRLSKEIM